MNDRQISHYMEWATAFYDHARGNVGVIGGDINYLWHGALERRAYRGRSFNIQAFGSDPFTDIAACNKEAWKRASAKADLHAYVGEVLCSRKIDG